MRKRIPYLTLLMFAFACFSSSAQPPVGMDGQSTRPVLLRFGDFYKLPVGPLGLEMTNTLLHADKKVVTLVGFVVHQENPLPGRFMLTLRPIQMSEHADGEADDLPPAMVVVYLDKSQQNWTIPHVRGLVSLTGTLSVGRQEEAAGRTSWVRMQLPPEAARTMNAVDLTSFQHSLRNPH